MDLSAIALQGLEQAGTSLDAAAAQLASEGGGIPAGADVNVVNLSSDMVSLMSAQTLFEANIATLKTADQIQQSLLDVMG